jgi:Mn-dependent DtxR family transcriptional regulator
MDYEKEFNVTADEVKKEVEKIQKEKRIEYDDYGRVIINK